MNFIGSFILLFAVAGWASPKSVSKTAPHKDETEFVLGLQQSAQILEQIWPLIDTKKKLSPKNNPFSLMARALEKQIDPTKKVSKTFPCEKITSSTVAEVANPLEKSRSFYFSCQKNRIFFARMNQKQDHQIDFELDPQGLEDVLGLKTSILGRKMSCSMSIDKKILSILTCQGLQMDFNEAWRSVFEKFEYRRNSPQQVVADIIFYDQIKPAKKVQIRVPNLGTVKVVETWLSPPPGYAEKGSQKKEAPKEVGKTDPKAGPVQAVDPDKPVSNPPSTPPTEEQARQAVLPDQILKQEDEKRKAIQQGQKGEGSSSAYPDPEYIEDPGPEASSEDPATPSTLPAPTR